MSAEITTAEELDALPVGSVVRTLDGHVFEKFAATPTGWGDDTLEPDSFERWQAEDISDAFDLPATLLYRPDRPILSDDDLREEAARRGMTVVDAQEWARVRAIADGPTPATDEAACPTCGCPTECPEGLAEERDRLRTGIEALASEWEAEALRNKAAVRELRTEGKDCSVTLRHQRLCARHAARLRALLPAADEKAGA